MTAMSSQRSPRAGGSGAVAVLIMAAGLGTRMKSDLPKVLHPVCGRPMVLYAVDAAASVAPARLVVLTAPGHDAVAEVLPDGCERAVQQRQLGTGDAVREGIAHLDGFEGDLMVLSGDVPLVGPEFVAALLERHRAAAAAATVTALRLRDPGHYGRIVRDADGGVSEIVESRDCTPEQASIDEINVGAYVFACGALRAVLPALRADNSQGEFYLTDVIRLLLAGGETVVAFETDDEATCMGVNSRVELAEVNRVMRRRLLDRLMLSGVTIDDPATTYVDFGVWVGRDSVIGPQTTLTGTTCIGDRSHVGPGCVLRDVTVGDDARVVSSHLLGCRIGDGCSIGPYAHVRPGTVLAAGARAGSFVEIKASLVGEGSKVPHLSYVGDTTIGENTNVGAGTITANYDGESKHATTIGSDVKIGSDTVLVAPVTVGDGAYTAAGSVITRDVPAGDLGVARSRQENLSDYAARRKLRREVDG
jgi:bifunctional UDP-N-acetylglucosamine pyrophosphorylase / glucosamine-1-phosphate N-acetyltransferase